MCLQEDAEQAFVEANTAYETLSNPETRRRYDIEHSIRRMGFFRDVDPDEEEREKWRKDPFERMRQRCVL